MRKIFAILAAASIFAGCDDNVNEVFSDYFVCIKDENEAETSVIQDSSNGLVSTYYIYLVAPVLDEDVTVGFELVPGSGLQEGRDYEVRGSARSVTIARGIVKMPVRITWKARDVDPQEDNTVTIRLTDVSRKGINIGYPGPKSLFSTHVITKVHSK